MPASPTGKSPNTPPTVIDLFRLEKRYEEGDRERLLFRGLDLQVSRGEAVILLGRSGSGKSTLLNLISGIDQPSAGRVCVDGVDLTALNEEGRSRFRRRQIGFVYQFFNLIPTLTVEENVRLPLDLNNRRSQADRQRVLEMLSAVDLTGHATRFPDTLSGGEQQRVALARALVHQPAVVLADEPTGNLDAETGRRILELLTGLVRDSGTTLVMVTHGAEAGALGDRVLRLEAGRLEVVPP